MEPLPRTPRQNRTPAGGGGNGGSSGDSAYPQPQRAAEPLVPYLSKVQFRGGGYAILMAFYGPPDRSTSVLSREDIFSAVEARSLCDGPFRPDWHAGVVTGRTTPGWKSIDTLLKHGYVARTAGGRAANMAGESDRFMLTAKGRDFIPLMLRKFSVQGAPVPGTTTPPRSVSDGPSSGQKRGREYIDPLPLPLQFPSAKPNTGNGHKLSTRENPKVTPQEALRQRWATVGPSNVNVQAMTNKELKAFLSKHGVPFVGVTERAELVALARTAQAQDGKSGVSTHSESGGGRPVDRPAPSSPPVTIDESSDDIGASPHQLSYDSDFDELELEQAMRASRDEYDTTTTCPGSPTRPIAVEDDDRHEAAGSPSVVLYIDERERRTNAKPRQMLTGLHQRLHPDGSDADPFAGVAVEKTVLCVGDFQWAVRRGDALVLGDTIVERKTILDLAGRLARKDHLRQILRMVRSAVRCPLLLIEGDAKNTIAPHARVYDQPEGSDEQHLDVHSLTARLAVCFEGRVKVARTSSVDGTYELLAGLTALIEPASPARTLDDFKRADKKAQRAAENEPNVLNQQLQSARVAPEVACKAAQGVCERFGTNEELREVLLRADPRCRSALLAPCLGGDLLLAAQVCAAALGQPPAAASSLRAEAPRRARVSVHTGWRADLQRALDAEAVVEFEDFEPGEEAAGTEGALSLLTVQAVHGDACSELHEIVLLPERARRQCVLLRAWLHAHGL